MPLRGDTDKGTDFRAMLGISEPDEPSIDGEAVIQANLPYRAHDGILWADAAHKIRAFIHVDVLAHHPCLIRGPTLRG